MITWAAAALAGLPVVLCAVSMAIGAVAAWLVGQTIGTGRHRPICVSEVVDAVECGSWDAAARISWYGAELRFRDVEAEIAVMQPHLDLLKACGATVMVFAETSGTVQGNRATPVADRPRMSEAEWPVFLERLDTLGSWMAGQGVCIAFHHHMGTVIETAAEINRLMEGTGDHVGLLYDTDTSPSPEPTRHPSPHAGHTASTMSMPRRSAQSCCGKPSKVAGASWTALSLASSPCPAMAAWTSPPPSRR